MHNLLRLQFICSDRDLFDASDMHRPNIMLQRVHQPSPSDILSVARTWSWMRSIAGRFTDVSRTRAEPHPHLRGPRGWNYPAVIYILCNTLSCRKCHRRIVANRLARSSPRDRNLRFARAVRVRIPPRRQHQPDVTVEFKVTLYQRDN